MSNTELNRQIVQEGLNRKKAARRQRMTDAAHDAAERQLRTAINQHAHNRQTEIETAEANERRLEDRRRQRAAARAKEEEEVKQTYRLAALVFDGLLYASIATLCFVHEIISAGVAFTAIGLATVYCIAAFTKHVSWTNRRGKRRAA